MNDPQCPNCESYNVEIIEPVEAERPNGDLMEHVKCEDCGLEWIE
jgi:hypothetical protein